jgi:pyruvate,water dikinase
MTQQEKSDVPLTLSFAEVSSADLHAVGGKGYNLGALTRAGLPVPPGFCVTTAAYVRFLLGLADAETHFAALEQLDGSDLDATRNAATSMRRALQAVAIPAEVERAVVAAWQALSTNAPLAVRSSATAEDLPGASFAGQQDTFLNVRGEAALLDAVRRCWVSLFTDRAVLYRAKNGFGHRGVLLSVVVQQLVDPDVSGILFTADPVSGHRGIISIDAGFGLGEALVSGLISADRYRVDRQRHVLLDAQPGDKAIAIRSLKEGGTEKVPLPDSLRRARALDDAQVLALAELGERVQAHYGGVPQDIEWCIAGEKIFLLQARPITSLFPIPTVEHPDGGPRIFLSFGHFQMMTDAMPRLATDVWGYFFPTGKNHALSIFDPPKLSPAMVRAGGRLYLDATLLLRAKIPRAALLGMLGYAYAELARSAAALASRPEFARIFASSLTIARTAARILGPPLRRVPLRLFFTDPQAGAARVDRKLSEYVNAACARIAAAPTPAARIRQSAIELNSLFSQIEKHLAQMASGLLAHRLLARLAKGRWADGVREDVDRLMRGLPGNVTTEMDLAVGDLRDQVRPYAELSQLLQKCPYAELRTKWASVDGGSQFAAALQAFLARYGDRGAGEIDLSRSRWRDDPSMLFRVITGGLANAGTPGAHRRQHATQIAEGEEAERRLVAAAEQGLLGFLRRLWVRRLCRVARFGLGLREHPKFTIVRVLGKVRQEVNEAAATLVTRGQLANPAQVFHLSFDELSAALQDPKVELGSVIAQRQEEFRRDQARKPPIVISSDGETPTLVPQDKDLPQGALRGTAASSGVVEGLARVIRKPEHEVLHQGEILIAPYTDPGWTPLFVHAAGVVTEVGGLLTHGAVVAREYGIPAVVSVSGALDRIRTGQRIRVDGTRGFVQILD